MALLCKRIFRYFPDAKKKNHDVSNFYACANDMQMMQSIYDYLRTTFKKGITKTLQSSALNTSNYIGLRLVTLLAGDIIRLNTVELLYTLNGYRRI